MKSSFGKLTRAYDRARQGYPKEIYQTLIDFKGQEARVLDLACGTGISTRELGEYFGRVIGVDIEAEMLEAASAAGTTNVEYHLGSAQNIPFESGYFDLITAFSAFHWFTDDASLNEIKRVLKPGGMFATINKTDKNSLRDIFKEVLKDSGVVAETSVKDGSYDPQRIMESHGFADVERKVWKITEKYTLENALLLMQSWNAWAYLPQEASGKALERIKNAYAALVVDGEITRELEVMFVTGVREA